MEKGNLNIAAVCMHSAPGEIEKNLDRMQSFVSEASKAGADIVCFPELCVTGYVLTRPFDVYGGLDSERVMERMVRMAREAALVLIAGLVEISDDEKPYISQVIAGPEGLIGIYRKTHLSPAEKDVYGAGQEIKVFSHESTTFGVQLCYEAHFPEISTRMALMGADIVFIPHASPRGEPNEKFKSWLRHLPARAFDNGMFVVACNQMGKTGAGLAFPGVAVVFGPDGRLLAKYMGKSEKILFAELEAGMLRDVRTHRMRYFLPERRPELYKKGDN
ncbi:MAG: nitrilase [Deltaproteobacteria bacterium]|nr:nitrilase [Deltaproteobacteria bacterium]